jgi:hypothetical protein
MNVGKLAPTLPSAKQKRMVPPKKTVDKQETKIFPRGYTYEQPVGKVSKEVERTDHDQTSTLRPEFAESGDFRSSHHMT